MKATLLVLAIFAVWFVSVLFDSAGLLSSFIIGFLGYNLLKVEG